MTSYIFTAGPEPGQKNFGVHVDSTIKQVSQDTDDMGRRPVYYRDDSGSTWG